MTEFWNLIVQSNTFNFAILMLIFAIIYVKLDVPNIVESIRKEVANSIETAEEAQKLALKELKSAKKVVKTTDSEIEAHLASVKNNAKTLSQEIIQNATLQAEQIENNIEKAILTEAKKITTKLTQETIIASIELAKNKILNKLNSDVNLHNKLIEDSINELDKVEL